MIKIYTSYLAILYILGSSTVSGTVWYNVAWPSGQRVYYGWASSAYINKDNDNVSTQKALINTTSLNVRAGAGTGYSAIGTVSKGTEVKILQSITSTAGQEWYMIHYTKNGSSYTGCVLAKYVLTIDNVLDTGITPPSAHTNELDNKVLMLYGNPGGEKKVTQTVNVSGSKDDAFVVNLWGAGNPVKIKDSRTCGVEVVFVASDGAKGKAHVSSFEETGEGWMFLNDVVIADKD